MNHAPHGPYSLTQLGQKLVADNTRLAYWWVHRFLRGRPNLERYTEDLEFAALAGLCRAVATFNPTQGALSTWAWRPILSGLHTVSRSVAVRAQYGDEVQLANFGYTVPAALDDTDLSARLLAILNPRARAIVTGYYAGETFAEVGARYGLTKQGVRNSVHVSIQRMRAVAIERGWTWRELVPTHEPALAIRPRCIVCRKRKTGNMRRLPGKTANGRQRWGCRACVEKRVAV